MILYKLIKSMISLNNNILNNDEILTPINRIKINNNQNICLALHTDYYIYVVPGIETNIRHISIHLK